MHFSTAMPDGDWLIELRAARDRTTVPYGGGVPGQVIELPGGARLHLAARFTQRLWRARLSTAVVPYLLRHGAPIRYSYVRPGLADRGVPDRVRHPAGQRRDAQRQPAVHPADRDPAGQPAAS